MPIHHTESGRTQRPRPTQSLSSSTRSPRSRSPAKRALPRNSAYPVPVGGEAPFWAPARTALDDSHGRFFPTVLGVPSPTPLILPSGGNHAHSPHETEPLARWLNAADVPVAYRRRRLRDPRAALRPGAHTAPAANLRSRSSMTAATTGPSSSAT